MFSRENTSPGLILHQLGQFLFRQQQLAGQLDRGDGVLLALGDVDGDVDVLLVRRNRNLGRLDIEFEIAAIEVVRAHGLEVPGKLLLGILVVLGVPGQPVRRAQDHQVEQVRFLEGAGADDVDLLDLGDLALYHGKIDADAIALQRRDGRRHLNRVVALRKVLALEFLLRALDHGAVEDARLGEADIAQALLEVFGLEGLEPVNSSEAMAGRSSSTTTSTCPSISRRTSLKKPVANKRLDRRGRLLVVHGVAHLHRQVGEHGAGLGALDALDADILDLEGIEGQCGARQQRKTRPASSFLFMWMDEN
jgi:hypothetical protein